MAKGVARSRSTTVCTILLHRKLLARHKSHCHEHAGRCELSVEAALRARIAVRARLAREFGHSGAALALARISHDGSRDEDRRSIHSRSCLMERSTYVATKSRLRLDAVSRSDRVFLRSFRSADTSRLFPSRASSTALCPDSGRCRSHRYACRRGSLRARRA